MSLDEARYNFRIDAPNFPESLNGFYLLIGDNAYSYSTSATFLSFSLIGDIDTYFLKLTPGHSYSIVTAGSSVFGAPASNPEFALLGSDGSFLTLSQNGGLTFTAINSNYYVQGYTASPGFYTLRVGNNTIVETNGIGETIVSGRSYSAALDYISDVDIYNFSAIAGFTYEFAIVTSIPDLYLDVEYAGLQVDNLVSLGGSLFTFTAAVTGTYSLHLSSNSFVNTGSYTLLTDVSAPTVLTFNPTDAATGVAIGSNIVLTFSESIGRGTGNIQIRSGSASGTAVETFDAATSSNLSFSGSTLTINPISVLDHSTQYFVTVEPGSVKDFAGNSYIGTITYDFTTAAAPDTTAPTISTFNPTDAATGVAIGSNIVLTFSEAIGRGTGTIQIRSGTVSGNAVETFDAATSNNLSISESTLTINPISVLDPSTQYFVTFSPGSIKDLAGNPYTGINSYDFTTVAATVDIPALTSKYFVLAGSGANHVDYQLKASPLSLQGQFISQAGTTGVDAIHVRPGSAVDFTASGASADKVYLDGAYGDYGVSLTGTVMMLYRGSGAGRELVRVGKAASLVSSDILVFADGSVSTWDLFNLLRSGTALPGLGSETSLQPLAPAAPGSSLNATIKAFALDSGGETFASVGAGMQLIAVGSVGVDTVYVSDGSSVDATLLGASSDLIYLRGDWADYSKSVAGSVMTFSRSVNGQTETVKVIGGNGALNDKLVFADGAVLSNNAKLALNGDLNAAIETVTGYDPNTTTPGLRPVLQASALDNVSNLDVTSDIVLSYSESVTAQAGKYIRIVDDGGAGFRGESSNHTQLIEVTDSTQVSIVGGKVTLNPSFDLDLANNHHIEIDAGAFLGQASGQATEAYNGSSSLNFSTVTPGTGILANAAASQAIDTTGEMVAGHNWLDIEGIGSPSGDPTALDLANANYALVAKDFDASGGNSDIGYDGIQLDDLYVAANNFALGDLIYIDDQGNSLDALNDLTLAAVVDLGEAPTLIQFAGTSLGGFIEVSLSGSSLSFDSINALNQLVVGTAVISA